MSNDKELPDFKAQCDSRMLISDAQETGIQILMSKNPISLKMFASTRTIKEK